LRLKKVYLKSGGKRYGSDKQIPLIPTEPRETKSVNWPRMTEKNVDWKRGATTTVIFQKTNYKPLRRVERERIDDGGGNCIRDSRSTQYTPEEALSQGVQWQERVVKESGGEKSSSSSKDERRTGKKKRS